MNKTGRLAALTRAGVVESLQFRLGTAATLFGNLITFSCFSINRANFIVEICTITVTLVYKTGTIQGVLPA